MTLENLTILSSTRVTFYTHLMHCTAPPKNKTKLKISKITLLCRKLVVGHHLFIHMLSLTLTNRHWDYIIVPWCLALRSLYTNVLKMTTMQKGCQIQMNAHRPFRINDFEIRNPYHHFVIFLILLLNFVILLVIIFCYIECKQCILLWVCTLLIRLRGQTFWISRNNLGKGYKECLLTF